LGIDFIICFACVVLWVGVNTWVLVIYRMAGLAKALTDPNLTPTQKQQLAKELVSGVMVELGYTQAVDVKLVADSQDNRKGPVFLLVCCLGFCCCCLLNCHHHSFLRRIQHNR
jgi:hypothetical protein